jgi:GTP 3',8-cyclase
MKGSDIEDLRNQLNKDAEGMARAIGVPVPKYPELVRLQSIKDLNVITRVLQLQTKVERDNIEKYAKDLSQQPTGPFASGKILAHLGEIANLRMRPRKAAPITVEWHLSNSCDHACPLCTFGESVHSAANPDRRAMFPEDLVECVVDDLKTLRARAVVYSGGGEPLLHPQAAKVMWSVRNAGIEQGLITNGSRLGEQVMADAIVDTCRWVRISVDAGTPEKYREMHGRACDFARTKDNIANLIARRGGRDKPVIGVSFLLTISNYTDLLRAAGEFRDVGVDYFQVKPIVISAEERVTSGNVFWREGIFQQLKALPDQATNSYQVYTLGFKFVDLLTAIDEKPFSRCHGHPFYPVITATGDVYVCCLMIGKEQMCYGRITKNKGFKELWDSDKRLQIGQSVNVRECPINCKLSETNETLEHILVPRFKDPNFLN